MKRRQFKDRNKNDFYKEDHNLKRKEKNFKRINKKQLLKSVNDLLYEEEDFDSIDEGEIEKMCLHCHNTFDAISKYDNVCVDCIEMELD